ncbi:uncharacterized protein PHALS_09422 [Plasmopara halstedii]|uniref:Uncharacterized protein n=1 Tax=Plasmopara halstedii TaxID=4781 RepID=A0A0P1A4N6_PLAHL|nr:uncharacterized protein PHALS_09422 [Plasmopara halstedii]CEG35296.1 hypothetical protein PHALS_09422 [Plasmopara halstedii]|eukprot:XP_024571665.1 hypothetical protein PHALS_09422 [Plasmopara halstedii]
MHASAQHIPKLLVSSPYLVIVVGSILEPSKFRVHHRYNYNAIASSCECEQLCQTNYLLTRL